MSDLNARLRKSEYFAGVGDPKLAEHICANGPAHQVGVCEASNLSDLGNAAVIAAAAAKLTDENRRAYFVSIHRASCQPLDVVREALVLMLRQFASRVADVISRIAASLVEAKDLVRREVIGVETDESVVGEIVEPLEKTAARVGTDEVEWSSLGKLDGVIYVHGVVKL